MADVNVAVAGAIAAAAMGKDAEKGPQYRFTADAKSANIAGNYVDVAAVLAELEKRGFVLSEVAPKEDEKGAIAIDAARSK